MTQPLVSIICLCYNHERFLREALDSVLAQTYPRVEVIVVDDLSLDNSVAIIQEYVAAHPHIQFIQHAQNQGNCRSFNEAFALSKGEFIIDFATDDVLHPERLAKQVAAFETLPEKVGVVYTDAELIDEQSKPLGLFYRRNTKGEIFPKPAQGDVFADVLGRYFICPPTMMVRRQVLQGLGGYDTTLAYEDFDFWVRSARNWHYHFLDEVLCQRREHASSLSNQIYKPGDRQLQSTIQIIQKAQILVQNEREKEALVKRIQYEARHAYFTGNYPEALTLLQMLEDEGGMRPAYRLLKWLTQKRVPLQMFRKWYHLLRYGRIAA
ncbi:glycosyl transferase [Rufibacter sp. DG15C]|uniref:glycosyltransferase n=1 Tax=Rufibacter sp. DG15C TaxID=1379909 RepID=UPI00078B3230|nr:glycosyltransferase [Rufibacter sp. DG15C]AMM50242.1 glycosyl transferase [Rufibacter sp. DG15C]